MLVVVGNPDIKILERWSLSLKIGRWTFFIGFGEVLNVRGNQARIGRETTHQK